MDGAKPTQRQIRRWRRYLEAERAEAAVYRDLASRREGEEREILLALAEAEGRHEAHWIRLLGDKASEPHSVDLRTRFLGWLARRFGSVFVLALAQRAEARSPYDADKDATKSMAADERVHEEVIRGLAARGRSKISGTFRAAVFGANDGLVSNLALVLGVAATGVSAQFVLISGLAGLLAGALSMGAGEYVSVSSQRELLEPSRPLADSRNVLSDLDVNANELALVYRARGMSEADAESHAAAVLKDHSLESTRKHGTHEVVGTGMGVATSSFCAFALGALLPILPYLFGVTGSISIVIAIAAVGIGLFLTGGTAGLLSGASPLRRAVRQLLIGFGVAAITYVLGLIIGFWLE
ncbi:MAG: VIT1/CCC1 transporter family protein [Cryobacterium sp.]|nr:VIT1/CCC1 transporter family protein [Cryobacterium sp.]